MVSKKYKKLFFLIFFSILIYSCKKEDTIINTSISVPTNPQNLSAISSIYGTKLSWQTPVDNGGSVITNYLIYRGTTNANLINIGTVVFNTTDYVDKTGTDSLTYYYDVTAVNSKGESIHSNKINYLYRSVKGNWTFKLIQYGGYNNPPPTIFYIDTVGVFQSNLNLWIGTYSGSNHYGTRTISGTVGNNNQIENGRVIGGSQNGQFVGSFSLVNDSASGTFTNWVLDGSNPYQSTGTWSAKK